MVMNASGHFLNLGSAHEFQQPDGVRYQLGPQIFPADTEVSDEMIDAETAPIKRRRQQMNYFFIFDSFLIIKNVK